MRFKIFILLLFILSVSLPVYADIIWPSLYIAKGMLSIKIILLGLVIETLFVKYFIGLNWKKACLISFSMNLITTAAGMILIPISGLGAELVFDFIFNAYNKFGIGTFHWSHWLVSYFLVILLNTLIEGLFIKMSLKMNFKKVFWWLFAANAISVLLCFIFYGTKI